MSNYVQDVCVGCQRLTIPKNKKGRCTGFTYQVGWEDKPLEYCQWRTEIEIMLGLKKNDSTPKRA